LHFAGPTQPVAGGWLGRDSGIAGDGVAGAGLAPYSPVAVFPSDALSPPGARFLFGTDTNGMDVFSRVIYGIRYAYGIALPAVAIGLLFGIPLG